jgi:uncharacterized protein with HEPN domain
MRREVKKHLYDIKIAIESIESYLGANRNFFEYQKNKMLRRAVERELEIIGEAMNRVLKTNPRISIKNAKKIVGTRNWIIHGYDKVDDVIVWGIISKHLPLLKQEIIVLLEA